MKILSIIIPTYNMEKYLRRCLDSLIIDEEGMKKIEVLVINDGSKDSSSSIAHEYQDRYPNTYRVIDKENGNYGSCINRGLKEATGKYVKVLDADDYFDNKNFETLIHLIPFENLDMIITSYNIVNEDGNVTKNITFNLPDNKLLLFRKYSNKIKRMQMHAVMYKTDNLKKIKYTQSEGISYTDQEWMFLPMTTVQKMVYYNIDIYQYLIGREGQTMNSKQLIRNISHTEKGIFKMISIYKERKYNSMYINYLESRILNRLVYIYDAYMDKSYNMDRNRYLELDVFITQNIPKIWNKVKLKHKFKTICKFLSKSDK